MTGSEENGSRVIGFNTESSEIMDENSMNHIHLTNDSVPGSYEWKGKLDLLNIVMIGLAEKLPEHELCQKGNRGIS